MKPIENKPGQNSSGQNIKNVLGEEVNPSVVQENTINKNDDDFTLDPDDEIEEPEVKNSSEEKIEPEEQVKEETKKIVEKNEIIAPDGSKTIQTTTTETTELNAVKARAIKPNMMLLMWDMFMPKIGGAIYPDTPSSHWKLEAADKGDLTMLITESANEGDWKGVPTKIFLLIALAAIILVKWRSRNEKINTSTNNDNSLEHTKALLLAKEEAKAQFVKYEEDLEQMKKRNDELELQMKKLMNKGSTYYEELTEEEVKRQQEKVVHDANQIIKEAQYKGFDLEKIRFSVNGGFVDKDKAGLKGYNAKGVKIGTPSAEVKDLFNKWKDYHTNKGEVPYFVA